MRYRLKDLLAKIRLDAYKKLYLCCAERFTQDNFKITRADLEAFKIDGKVAFLKEELDYVQFNSMTPHYSFFDAEGNLKPEVQLLIVDMTATSGFMPIFTYMNVIEPLGDLSPLTGSITGNRARSNDNIRATMVELKGQLPDSTFPPVQSQAGKGLFPAREGSGDSTGVVEAVVADDDTVVVAAVSSLGLSSSQ